MIYKPTNINVLPHTVDTCGICGKANFKRKEVILFKEDSQPGCCLLLAFQMDFRSCNEFEFLRLHYR